MIPDLYEAKRAIERLNVRDPVNLAACMPWLKELHIIGENAFGYEISKDDYETLRPFFEADKKVSIFVKELEEQYTTESKAVLMTAYFNGDDVYVVTPPSIGKRQIEDLKVYINDMCFLSEQEGQR